MPIYTWHSQLKPKEKHLIWSAVSQSNPCVVIGARSALFCPFFHLGIIIVDEAHDGSYKQGDGIRYNARDMAVMRGVHEGCPVILGSATPSLESMYNVHQGKYSLLSLTHRPMGAQLPQVRLVDLRQERTIHQNAPAFSMTLVNAIQTRLQRGEQSILFLNRISIRFL